MPSVVCQVQARPRENRDADIGELIVRQISDTNFTIHFEGAGKSYRIADFDETEFFDNDIVVRLNYSLNEDSHESFYVESVEEFELLKETFRECRDVCDIALRLNAIIRDTYYAGIYQSIDRNEVISISDELQLLRERVESSNMFDIFHGAESSGSATKNRSRVTNDARNAIQQQKEFLNSISCVYCEVSRATKPTKGYAVHPYVPVNFQKETTFMCLDCLENWKEFRVNADREDLLVLAGEINEELCAVCSDSPAQLTMCSSCPRSFCNPCLVRILTTKQLERLQKDEDWCCMCCKCGIDAEAPEVDNEHWRVIDFDNPQDVALFSSKTYPSELSEKVTKSSKRATPKSLSKSTTAAESGTLKRLKNGKKAADSTPLAVPKESSGVARSSSSTTSASISAGSGGRRHAAAEVESYNKVYRTNSGSRAAARERIGDEDVHSPPAAAAAAAATKVNVSDTKKRKSGHDKVESIEAVETVAIGPEEAADLPPVNTELDEYFYFSQYVQYYDKLCCQAAAGDRTFSTDDFCFLCKDGGELVECDWRVHGSKGKRCRKVYHTYCLAYSVDDDDEWRCPRHFCDVCGTDKLKYVCKYCPISLCKDCPEDLVKKYGMARYLEVEAPVTGEYNKDVTAIVCQNCLDTLDRSYARGQLNENKRPRDGVLKRFPGTPGKEALSGVGVFRKFNGTTSEKKTGRSQRARNREARTGAAAGAIADDDGDGNGGDDHLEDDDAVLEFEGAPAKKRGRRPWKNAGTVASASATATTSASISSAKHDGRRRSSAAFAANAPGSSKWPDSPKKERHFGEFIGRQRLWTEQELRTILAARKKYGTDFEAFSADPACKELATYRSLNSLKKKFVYGLSSALKQPLLSDKDLPDADDDNREDSREAAPIPAQEPSDKDASALNNSIEKNTTQKKLGRPKKEKNEKTEKRANEVVELKWMRSADDQSDNIGDDDKYRDFVVGDGILDKTTRVKMETQPEESENVAETTSDEEGSDMAVCQGHGTDVEFSHVRADVALKAVELSKDDEEQVAVALQKISSESSDVTSHSPSPTSNGLKSPGSSPGSNAIRNGFVHGDLSDLSKPSSPVVGRAATGGSPTRKQMKVSDSTSPSRRGRHAKAAAVVDHQQVFEDIFSIDEVLSQPFIQSCAGDDANNSSSPPWRMSPSGDNKVCLGQRITGMPSAFKLPLTMPTPSLTNNTLDATHEATHDSTNGIARGNGDQSLSKTNAAIASDITAQFLQEHAKMALEDIERNIGNGHITENITSDVEAAATLLHPGTDNGEPKCPQS